MTTLEKNSFEILKLSGNTIIAFDGQGICLDTIIDPDHWFSDKPKNITGFHFSEIFPVETLTVVKQVFENISETKSKSDLTFEWKSNNKTLFFELTFMWGGDNIVAFIKNITQHILYEAHNNSTTNNSLEPVRSLLANISHQLKNPLYTVVGFSRLLFETEKAEEKIEYMHIIENNNAKLINLVNEVMEITRIDSGLITFDIDVVNLHLVCKEVYYSYNLRIPYEAELVFENQDIDALILTDKNRLIQVLSNLIGNAIKYTPTGSIRFGFKRLEHMVEIYVKDTGIGIPEEKQKNIFDRFYKVDNFAQGTGLGLSICKSIVEKLGGKISFTSTPGEGSCFTFTLPLNGTESC